MCDDLDQKERPYLIWLNKYEGHLFPSKIKQRYSKMSKFFRKEGALQMFLQQQPNSITGELRFVLIVQDSCSSKFLTQVHTNNHICGIFLYSNKTSAFRNINANKHGKVVGIFNELKDFRVKLERFVRLHRRRLQSSWVFYGPLQKSIRTIGYKEDSEEKTKFIWFQLFKHVVINLDEDSSSRRDLIKQFRRRHYGNELQLRYIDRFEQDYYSAQAIYWYSKSDFPVFSIINRALRTEDPIELFNYRLLIRDLSEQIRVLSEKEKRTSSITVFRGCREMINELRRLRENIGNVIVLNGFLSCSKNREVAVCFADINGVQNIKEIPIIYEVEADSTIAMADISKVSRIPDEEEVLFDLGVIFQVISVNCDVSETYWIVRLKATADGSLLAKEFLDFNQMDLTTGKTVDVLYGELLIEIGEHTKASRFFEDLAKYQPTSEIHCHLGRIYSVLGEYDRSATFFQLALSQLRNNPHRKSINTVRVLRGIGRLYTFQGNFDRARETYEEALREGKTSFPNNEHYEFTLLFNDIGSVLEDQGKYDDAIKHLDQMLVICDHIRLPSIHPIRALARANLGNINTTLKKYDLSLKYQLEAFFMHLKLLPHRHHSFGADFTQLGRVFIWMKQFECAQICLETARDIVSATVPDNHLMRAEYLLQYGDLSQQKRHFHHAFFWYQHALSSRQKFLPLDHRDIGFVYEKIGDSLRELRQTQEAIEYYQHALDIYIAKLSPDHPFIGNLKGVLAQIV